MCITRCVHVTLYTINQLYLIFNLHNLDLFSLLIFQKIIIIIILIFSLRYIFDIKIINNDLMLEFHKFTTNSALLSQFDRPAIPRVSFLSDMKGLTLSPPC